MSQYPASSTQDPASGASGVGSGTLVTIGLILAVLAVILMNVYVEMRVNAAKDTTVTYFQFTGSLDAGTEIESNRLEPVQVPVRFSKAFGKDAIRAMPNDPSRPIDGLGSAINRDVVEGEFLRSSLILGSGGTAGRNNPELGEHQIAISVDSEDQPANLAPGDRIDLYGAIPLSRSEKNMVVMEYVRVAAVGERRADSADGTRANKYGSITINIDPKQVPLLFDIQRRLPEKQFRISLRAKSDTTTDITGGEAVINPAVLTALRLD